MEATLRYKHVASLVFDQPLMIEPHKAALVARYVASRIAGSAFTKLAVQVDDSTRRDRQQLAIVNGIAVIDVTGMLVHRAGQMDGESSPILSYEQLQLELDAAVRSPEVRGIVLRIDSPGGECSGCFDLADRIFNARKAKPVWAVAADTACSAAYLLASAAERVIVSQSAVTGSIGVVLNRLDLSKALDAEGVQVIQIAQGARKLDGSPTQPWREGSEEDKALQAFTARHYELFVSAVARYRGVSAESVRATDAAVFVGVDAVTAGLATKVSTLDLTINEMRASVTGPGRALMTGSPKMKLTLEQFESENPELLASIRADAVKAATPLTREQVEAQYPAIVAAIRADAVKPLPLTAEQERARVMAIQALHGPAMLAQKAIDEGWSAERAALEMRKAEIAGRKNRIDALRSDDANLPPIAPSAAGGEQVGEPSPQLVAAKARHYVTEQAKQGLNVTVAEAVRHVRQTLGLPSTTTPTGAQQ